MDGTVTAPVAGEVIHLHDHEVIGDSDGVLAAARDKTHVHAVETRDEARCRRRLQVAEAELTGATVTPGVQVTDCGDGGGMEGATRDRNDLIWEGTRRTLGHGTRAMIAETALAELVRTEGPHLAGDIDRERVVVAARDIDDLDRCETDDGLGEPLVQLVARTQPSAETAPEGRDTARREYECAVRPTGGDLRHGELGREWEHARMSLRMFLAHRRIAPVWSEEGRTRTRVRARRIVRQCGRE